MNGKWIGIIIQSWERVWLFYKMKERKESEDCVGTPVMNRFFLILVENIVPTCCDWVCHCHIYTIKASLLKRVRQYGAFKYSPLLVLRVISETF